MYLERREDVAEVAMAVKLQSVVLAAFV